MTFIPSRDWDCVLSSQVRAGLKWLWSSSMVEGTLCLLEQGLKSQAATTWPPEASPMQWEAQAGGEATCGHTAQPSQGAHPSSHPAQVTLVWVRKQPDSSSPQPRASPDIQAFPNVTPGLLSVFRTVSWPTAFVNIVMIAVLPPQSLGSFVMQRSTRMPTVTSAHVAQTCPVSHLSIYFYPDCRLPRRLRGKESPCNAGDAGDVGSIPGSGRSPGGGNGTPLQYSCLEKPMSLEGYSL